MIVPVEEPPPTTDAGAKVREESIPAGFTVKVPDAVVPLKVAFKASASVVETTDVLTVNVAELAPSPTETLEG